MQIGNVSIPQGALMAPMAGVTDKPFRQIVKRMGAAMTCTEMVSAKGLYYNAQRGQPLRALSPIERPVAIQFFGDEPQVIADMARRYASMFDIIDINMGCPAPKIVKNGQGSALMLEPERAEGMIRLLVRQVEQPVTVKFRKGWDDDHVNAVDFARRMEDAGAAAITVHGRTRQAFYSGEADWEIIARVKQAVSIPVIGNGDIFTAPQALERMRQSGVDGVMVARGAQGNPWIFRDILALLQGRPLPPAPSGAEKLSVALEHAQMLCELRGERVAIPALRKHMCSYLKGTQGVGVAREAVCHAESYSRLEEIMSRALMKCGE